MNFDKMFDLWNLTVILKIRTGIGKIILILNFFLSKVAEPPTSNKPANEPVQQDVSRLEILFVLITGIWV